ncbi:MAG: hypothetical protein CTY19_01165 [Methylomonas sp.]|nr:MAG: hypothetical protein CTY19_01165 [Methylomonas sp.]
MVQNLSLSQNFEIKPSHQHEKLFDLLHLLAILACSLSSLIPGYKVALVCLIIMLRLIANRRWHHNSFQLRFTHFSGWEMAFGHNDYRKVKILDTTVVTPFVIFLHFQAQNQPASALLVMKDSLSKDDFRRLIVRLKLSGHEQNR